MFFRDFHDFPMRTAPQLRHLTGRCALSRSCQLPKTLFEPISWVEWGGGFEFFFGVILGVFAVFFGYF